MLAAAAQNADKYINDLVLPQLATAGGLVVQLALPAQRRSHC